MPVLFGGRALTRPHQVFFLGSSPHPGAGHPNLDGVGDLGLALPEVEPAAAAAEEEEGNETTMSASLGTTMVVDDARKS